MQYILLYITSTDNQNTIKKILHSCIYDIVLNHVYIKPIDAIKLVEGLW